jgi:hypothetical protein
VQIRSLLETGTDTERREKLLAVLNTDTERESAGVGLSPPDSVKSMNPKPNSNLAGVRKEDNMSFLDWAEKTIERKL